MAGHSGVDPIRAQRLVSVQLAQQVTDHFLMDSGGFAHLPITNFQLWEMGILRITGPDILDKEGIKCLCLFLIPCHCTTLCIQPMMETLLGPPFAGNVFIETFFVVFNCSSQKKKSSWALAFLIFSLHDLTTSL